MDLQAQRQEASAKQLVDESRELKEKALADRREMEGIRDGIQALREQTNRKQLALEEVGPTYQQRMVG